MSEAAGAPVCTHFEESECYASFSVVLCVLLLAACGGDGENDKDKGDKDDNSGGSGGQLSTVTVSGAVSAPFTVDEARVDDLSAATGIFTIVLADMENDYSQDMAVAITVPAAMAQAGTYDFGQPAASASDVPFATFIDNREGVTSYSGTSGSVTLDSVGDAWGGRFEFTASTSDGQTVTASGTFSGLPVQVFNLGG